MNHSMVFTDPLNGWISIQDCYCAEGLTRIAHTADGGLTWQDQISGNYTAGETLFIGDFKFVDPKTGWFLLSPSRGWGPGGGPPNRTLLYHTTDGGGGAIGEPMPTIELPDVGSAEPSAGSGHWPPVLLLAGLALAGGALIARWRTP